MTQQIFDVSTPITKTMAVYKDKPEKRPDFTVTSNFPEQSVRETRIHLDVHTGTHVDAPLHMMPDGDTTSSLRLENLLRECQVYDLTHVTGSIRAADLEPLTFHPNDFVLFKTKNSYSDTFDPEFVFVAEDAAEFLAAKRIVGVGVDALGIERSQPGHPTHKKLFAANATIIEGLRLASVEPGRYELIALPLPLPDLDAAPARVILRTL